MKTVDIKYEQVVREMEQIENEASIQFNNTRKVIARWVINHFTKEHIPPIKEPEPKFTIPKEMQDDPPIESPAETMWSEGPDVLRSEVLKEPFEG